MAETDLNAAMELSEALRGIDGVAYRKNAGTSSHI